MITVDDYNQRQSILFQMRTGNFWLGEIERFAKEVWLDKMLKRYSRSEKKKKKKKKGRIRITITYIHTYGRTYVHTYRHTYVSW